MYSKTIVVGNLGRDPEMRYTSGGQAVTTFSVAASRKYTGQDGKPVEKTTWFRVTAWGKLGELCNTYLAKGRQVLVEGEVEASAWTGQDGKPRASLELTAKTVRFLGGKPGAPAEAHDESEHENGSVAMDEEEIPF